MSSNPFYIDVCEWLIFWALWMKSFILSSLFFNCYWLFSVIMCPAFYVKGYRTWFFYFIYHYRDEIVELLYNWTSLKSLFYNTLVYLSRSWKYDRDWHCNNYICATSKNSWHIVYILLTLKPMIQLPKKPKNSLMKNDMECKFKNRLSSRCNVQNSI